MGKFEIFSGADGHFYFHLKAENGEIVAASQGYTTKQSAENGIAAIKRIAAQAEVSDLKLAHPHNSPEPIERSIL
jgi:hypothetical protein